MAAPGARDQGQLGRHLGPGLVERLLDSPLEGDRLRGLERLGSLGAPAAIDLLSRVIQAELGQSVKARLVAARSLAPHAGQPEATRTLIRLMTWSSSPHHADPLEEWARTTAALALARVGTESALRALGQALLHRGPVARAAAEALVARPPAWLDAILPAPQDASLALLEMLERLGDRRALEFLRRVVRHAPRPVAARAAVALARMGDCEAVELARSWLRPGSPYELLVPAAWILALGQSSDAPRAISALLSRPSTRAEGIELSLLYPDPELGPRLSAELAGCAEQCERLVTALGRIGGQPGARVLGVLLHHPQLARAAAYALALASGREALAAIERGLADPELRPTMARAAVVRKITLREEATGLVPTLETLLRSSDPAERAAGSWGLSVCQPERASRLAQHPDPVVARAAARALLVAGGTVLAAERWATSRDPVTRAAFGIGLVTEQGADQIPTERLLAALGRADPLAPLVARALAARDSPELRPLVEELLASGDPLVRGHTALGLGRCQSKGAVGLLEGAYRFEPDPYVRGAIVRALSRCPDPARRRVLELAAEFDQEESIRHAARNAASGARLAEVETGAGVLWLDVTSNEPQRLPTLVLVTSPTGVSVPTVADPDGLVVLSGLPRGPVNLRVVTFPEDP